MREILFRGKCTLDGRLTWTYGDLLHSDGKVYIHPKANLFRVNGDLSKLMVTHEVDPETVGQYTGLTDNNGKKIFEGDILDGCDNVYTELYSYPVVNIGEFFDGNVSNDLEYESNGYLGYGVYISTKRGQACIAQEHAEGFAVIGNIHDNPAVDYPLESP